MAEPYRFYLPLLDVNSRELPVLDRNGKDHVAKIIDHAVQHANPRMRCRAYPDHIVLTATITPPQVIGVALRRIVRRATAKHRHLVAFSQSADHGRGHFGGG